jgi:hypothetical protein
MPSDPALIEELIRRADEAEGRAAYALSLAKEAEERANTVWHAAQAQTNAARDARDAARVAAQTIHWALGLPPKT